MKYIAVKNEEKIANVCPIVRSGDRAINQIEHIFEVVIEPDEDRYHAYCPSLKGCRTWGRTKEEAHRNIKEAIELYLEALIEEGDPIPNIGLVKDPQDIKPIIKVKEKTVV